MSEPTPPADAGSDGGPAQGKGPDQKAAKGVAASAPAFAAGQVVDFTHVDVASGRTIAQLGVVLWAGGDNESLLIAPVGTSYLQVPPENAAPVTFD